MFYLRREVLSYSLLIKPAREFRSPSSFLLISEELVFAFFAAKAQSTIEGHEGLWHCEAELGRLALRANPHIFLLANVDTFQG